MSQETNKLLVNVALLKESLERLNRNLDLQTEARMRLEKAQRDKIDFINERLGHINIQKWKKANDRKF
ncbi:MULTISPECIES: hypothetical protein [Paenibacillus]|uniref:Phage protein n=2 Tax=Paenibacillus TaxID=44249 RepID=A0ABX2ZFL9_PAEPO|nr:MULTISPECIES: hypothetical protein [Paenibacillus]MDR6779524.1 hypothetical protein [Paenibacillus peoriae]ODA09113.1 hypothetical protein A7312_27225 [Paenibacillus polymyxa]